MMCVISECEDTDAYTNENGSASANAKNWIIRVKPAMQHKSNHFSLCVFY